MTEKTNTQDRPAQVKMESGRHLGIVRDWIKWEFHNGCAVNWNSEDALDPRCHLTVGSLERLAQRIWNEADHQRKEREATIERLRSDLLRARCLGPAPMRRAQELINNIREEARGDYRLEGQLEDVLEALRGEGE